MHFRLGLGLKFALQNGFRRREIRSSYLAIREYFTRPTLHVEPRSSHLGSIWSYQQCLRPGSLNPTLRTLSQSSVRWQSNTSKGQSGSPVEKPPGKTQSQPEPSSNSGSTSPDQSAAHEDVAHHIQNYPRFLRRLAVSLPNPPHLHRPHRDDFLNIANNMWDRIRIRFKWLTIRGFRKWNADGTSLFCLLFLRAILIVPIVV